MNELLNSVPQTGDGGVYKWLIVIIIVVILAAAVFLFGKKSRSGRTIDDDDDDTNTNDRNWLLKGNQDAKSCV